jgi:hypothetical protein
VSTTLTEQYDNTLMAMRNNYKHTYTYDGNNNETIDWSETWDAASSSFKNDKKNTHTYNSNNNVLTYLSQTWNGTTWVNVNGNTNGYNASGDLINWEYYNSWNVAGSYYAVRSYGEYICTLINVGMDDVKANTFSMYPNPITADVVTINSIEQTEYMFSDLTGKFLQSGGLNAGENLINLNGISSGVYLMKVGRQTKKIVIE